LVQYGARGRCPFCCKDLLVTFLNCRFILICVFSWMLQSVPSQSNYKRQARHCSCFNRRVRRCWGLLCSELHRITFSCMAVRRNCYRLRHHGTGIWIRIWCACIGRLRHFCPEWQWHWKSHGWHYWH
jgi:hypothetical protein